MRAGSGAEKIIWKGTVRGGFTSSVTADIPARLSGSHAGHGRELIID